MIRERWKTLFNCVVSDAFVPDWKFDTDNDITNHPVKQMHHT